MQTELTRRYLGSSIDFTFLLYYSLALLSFLSIITTLTRTYIYGVGSVQKSGVIGFLGEKDAGSELHLAGARWSVTLALHASSAPIKHGDGVAFDSILTYITGNI